MDQKKTGLLLKELRNEKGLTQEQFAEIVGVSNRTVSRWENGNNMPDLDILIQISDYYEIDLRELLDGERKSEKMNKEVKETALKAVDYANSETVRYTQRVFWILSTGVICWAAAQIISHTSLVENQFLSIFSDFSMGFACGMMICGIVITSRYGKRIRAFKERVLKMQ